MANELTITRSDISGLYDSETGDDCTTEKVVEITDDCQLSDPDERCILLFTRAKRGRIVQISSPYPDEEYVGMHIHFFVDELDKEMNARPRNDTFGSWAKRLGLTKQDLKLLIEEHVPAA